MRSWCSIGAQQIVMMMVVVNGDDVSDGRFSC